MIHKPTQNDCPERRFKELQIQESTGKLSKEQIDKAQTDLLDEVQQMKKVPYRSLIGALSHLARHTRFDIQFTTFYHARYQTDPGWTHWINLKRALRYLKYTRDYEMEAKRDVPFLRTTCDSDLGGGDNSKSTTGYCQELCGVIIHASSRLQAMTAKSSTEAEIIALCDCVEQTVWIRNILQDLGMTITPVIECDNQPAIRTVLNNQLCKGNKHIARRYHFVKGYVDAGIIQIKYVPSAENRSDLLTKTLNGPQLAGLLQGIYKQP